jgi:uncharacterized protein
VPGAVGGFLGAVVLTNISLESAKSWMAGLLIFFGLVILVRFGAGMRIVPAIPGGDRAKVLSPIGLLGGFVDATGGGGWGPVLTPSLMTVTKHEPRRVVGTVNAAEFVVAVSVSLGFVFGTAHQDIPWLPVLGLVAGGVVVAPFAAKLAGRLPHAPMGVMVGGLVILVNAVTVIAAVVGDLPGWLDATLIVVWISLVAEVARRAWDREKAERAGAPVDVPA